MRCLSSRLSVILVPRCPREHSKRLGSQWIDIDRRHGIGLLFCGQLKDASRTVLRLFMRAPCRLRGHSTNPFTRGNLGTDALWHFHGVWLGAPTCIGDVPLLCLAGTVVALATCPAGTLASRGLAIDATFLDRHAPTVYGRPRSPQSSASRAGPPYASGAYLKCGGQ